MLQKTVLRDWPRKKICSSNCQHSLMETTIMSLERFKCIIMILVSHNIAILSRVAIERMAIREDGNLEDSNSRGWQL